ncbi:ABC transporter ATP-binding protein [Vallitalea okinawensis]|uniref:ABC transporter ATP-binding protein n=1 Tax=Vallitalea okinawensis TaxID=2078660 RepID=UPI000CFBDF46|nr:ABC transporter ATP-binding protein [Vallitalea okinawensis]
MNEYVNEAEIVLKVEGLSKTYKDITAVNNLSLQVHQGEIFGLLGHNGAGKSTTIECILGTKNVDGGCISLLGLNPRQQRKKLFENVGVQFQESSYQSKIRVDEICKITESLYKKTLDWKKLLRDFSLDHKHKSLVSQLSGGERQKLSVLLAFLHQPQIVFLDELTTGLDPKARRDMWKYIELLRDEGVTIFLTSHYMDEVEYLCDRICILKKGSVVAFDTPQNILLKSEKETLEDAYLYYTEMEVM